MKYLIKRTIRIIGNTLTQFLAIILIIAIGSLIFTGLLSTIRILDTWVDDYYTANKLANAWIYVDGVDQTEIDGLNKQYPDLSLEGRYTFKTDGVLNGQSVHYVFLSETEINEVQIISGNKRIDSTHVIVDESFANENNLELGSTFNVKLNQDYEFTVSALFQSPEFSYKSKDNSDGASNKSGVGVIYVSEEVIIQMLRQTDDYLDAEIEIKDKLEEAQIELDVAYQTLLREQKNFNREKIDVYAELDQNKQDLLDKRDEVYNQQILLNQNKVDIANGLVMIDQGITQTNAYFDGLLAPLHQQFQTLNDNPGLPNQTEWDAAVLLVQTNIDQINSLKQIELDKLYTQQASLLESQKQVQRGIALVNDGLIQIEDGLKKIDDGYVTADKEFKKAEKLLRDGFKEYEEGLEEFNQEKADAYQKLDDSVLNYYEILVYGTHTDKIEEDIKQDDRFVYWLDRATYPGNAMLENILRPIKVMTLIFPALFFVVAAVLILITMSKMVEHDRTQVAIMKALGLSTQTIRLSYLLYGWIAALSGSLIFGYFGNWLIPVVLLNIFTTRFSIPTIPITFYHDLSLYAILLSLFFASIAILLALRSVLKETPSQGLRPKPPKNARRSFLEKNKTIWSKFSYAHKLMIRNLTVGRVKIILSSIGVVGALALLIIGITLQNSANLTIKNTVGSYDFDASIQIVDEIPFGEIPDLPIKLSNIEAYKQVSADFGDQIIQLTALENHQELLKMKDVKNNLIEIESNTVIIPQSFAILNDLEVGDTLSFEIDEEVYSLIITDINNEYLGKTVTMSIDQFNRLGIESETNKFYIKTQSEYSESIKEQLIDTELVESVDSKINIINKSNEMLSMLNQVILIILIASFALTSTVIYNLASINIVEREREIATLRVLGYTHREVKRLINTENYVLLSLGTLFGVPVGIFLSQWISHMVSTQEFYMPDVIELQSIIISVSIAFVITFITNLILEVKIRRIQLVESLKAVE